MEQFVVFQKHVLHIFVSQMDRSTFKPKTLRLTRFHNGVCFDVFTTYKTMETLTKL